nr:AI-2E family transporter [Chloroflexota bacterium]
VLASFLIAPVISDQVRSFIDDAPAQLRELERSWSTSRNPLLSGPGDQALERAIRAIENPPAPPQEAALSLVTGVGGGIFGALALLAITFYYLMEKALLRRLVLLEVRPESRARVNRVWDDVEAKVGGWLRGQLTLCLIIGLTATVGYAIMDVRFWPLLGLWAGITEIIPILGPWLGGIPAVILALTQSWQKALIVTGFIVLLQLLENTVLVPRIMKGAVGLSPLTVFVAILAGTELMGIVGAVLAIPIAALIQVIITDYLDARRGAYKTSDVPTIPAWRWMRGPLQHVAAYPVTPDSPRGPVQTRPHSETSVATPNVTPAPPRTEPGWSSELLTRAAPTPSREE